MYYTSLNDMRKNYFLVKNKFTGKLFSRAEIALLSEALIDNDIFTYMETDTFHKTFSKIDKPVFSPLEIYNNRENKELLREYLQYMILRQYPSLCNTMTAERMYIMSDELVKIFLVHKEYIEKEKSSFKIIEIKNNFEYKFLDYINDVKDTFRNKSFNQGNYLIDDPDKVSYSIHLPFKIVLPNGICVVYKIGLDYNNREQDKEVGIIVSPTIYRKSEVMINNPTNTIDHTLTVESKIKDSYNNVEFEKLVFHLMWDMDII